MDYKIPAETYQIPPPLPSTFVDKSVDPVPMSLPHSNVVTPAEESSLLTTLQNSLSKLSAAIQERGDVAASSVKKKTCKPDDFLCNSGLLNLESTHMQGQLSKAVIKSFGTMMSDMVNTTISKSLVDFMAKHGSANGETLADEHKAMVQMAANVLQSVSSRVIKSFTFFIQMAISGAMWDLFQQVTDGVTSAYDKHQRTMSDMRAAAVINSPPEKFPKPSQPQTEFDPFKILLNAGALTALSYPGFDLMGSLKNNLFTGDHNNLVKKRAASVPPVLTPFGVLRKTM